MLKRYSLYKSGRLVYSSLSSSVVNFLLTVKQDRATLGRIYGESATSWLNDFLNDQAEIKLYIRGPVSKQGYVLKEESADAK